MLAKVKSWLNKEEPKAGFVDGPWQTYVKRLHIMKEMRKDQEEEKGKKNKEMVIEDTSSSQLSSDSEL